MKTITKHLLDKIWPLVNTRIPSHIDIGHSLRFIDFNYFTWTIRRYWA